MTPKKTRKRDEMARYMEQGEDYYGPAEPLIADRPKAPSMTFQIDVPCPVSDQAQEVIDMLAEWAVQFNLKNQDYTNSDGNVADNFGVMGQFMKLKDKIQKLKKPLWDAEIVRQAIEMGLEHGYVPGDMNYEGPEEILDDIIGHALLAKLKLRERK